MPPSPHEELTCPSKSQTKPTVLALCHYEHAIAALLNGEYDGLKDKQRQSVLARLYRDRNALLLDDAIS